jgi:hypothetical protein
MRKALMLLSAVVLTAIFTGCSSVPKNPNLSGKWSYQYGKELERTGSFDLMQEGSELKGTSNDAEGQYDVTGTILGSVLSLEGQCPKTKKKYIVNAKMKNEDEFEGTYTTSVGAAGKITGQRQ